LRWKKSKPVAQMLTFLFSAFLHEFLLAVIFRIVRPIFLGFIMFQLPLIKFTKWMEKSRGGLYLTWFGLILGPSLILCCYLIIHEDVTLMFAKR
jgi:sterol O-acyltransferase